MTSILLGYVDADHASHESRRSIIATCSRLQEALTVVEDRFLNPSSLFIAGSEIRAVFALREAIKPVLYFKKDFILLSLTDIFCVWLG